MKGRSNSDFRYVLDVWQARQKADGTLVSVLAIATVVPVIRFLISPGLASAWIMGIFLFAVCMAWPQWWSSSANLRRSGMCRRLWTLRSWMFTSIPADSNSKAASPPLRFGSPLRDGSFPGNPHLHQRSSSFPNPPRSRTAAWVTAPDAHGAELAKDRGQPMSARSAGWVRADKAPRGDNVPCSRQCELAGPSRGGNLRRFRTEDTESMSRPTGRSALPASWGASPGSIPIPCPSPFEPPIFPAAVRHQPGFFIIVIQGIPRSNSVVTGIARIVCRSDYKV